MVIVTEMRKNSHAFSGFIPYNAILELALDKPELSARELAVLYTEREEYFVSESSVYRLLKAGPVGPPSV